MPYSEDDEFEYGDNANEEYEDEEFDDEEEDLRVKKKRRPTNMFLDVEAAVDDEEEDYEDEDDDLAREDGFIQEDEVPSTATRERHYAIDRRRQQEEDFDAEAVAARFQDRYSRQDYSRGTYPTDAEYVPQRFLVPGVDDPNLWMMKCTPGYEKDITFTIMRKFFDREYTDNPLEIFSIFSKESLKGYIYIEARKQAHVQQAIANVNHLYSSTLKLVPINEMVDVVSIKKKQLDLQPGGWVRIRRGRYGNDLAQIIAISDSMDSVRLRLIPRLEIISSEKPTTPEAGKRKKTPNSQLYRPSQKLFNPKEIEKYDRNKPIMAKAKGYYTYGNDTFKDGFLEKEMKIASLVIENVNPTLDEIIKFVGSAADEEQKVAMLSTLAGPAVTSQLAASDLRPGDHVEVAEGDLMHLHGVVIKIENTLVTLRSEVAGWQDSITLPVTQLRKRFSHGDHVKVIHGKHSGETGLIVKIVDNVVTMLSDLALNEVTVFAKDLRKASEVTSSNAAFTHFELEELVSIDPHTVGVIVKMERDSLRVLDQSGSLRNLKTNQISTYRKNNRDAFTMDTNGNSIGVGDTVREIGGEKRTGNILYIHRYFVFVKSRDYVENSGIFVLNSRKLVCVGINQGRDNNNFRAPLPVRGRNSRGRGGGRRGNSRLVRESLGKSVTITSGAYKGYLGVVKEINDQTARVELHTNSKVVSVDVSRLVTKDATGRSVPLFENDRAQTPIANSPASWNSPAISGSKTPMHRYEGAMTPNPYFNDGSKTPAWDSGSRTPNPRAGDDGWKTPAWDANSSNLEESNNAGDSWNTFSTPAAIPDTPAAPDDLYGTSAPESSWGSSATSQDNPQTETWGSDNNQTNEGGWESSTSAPQTTTESWGSNWNTYSTPAAVPATPAAPDDI